MRTPRLGQGPTASFDDFSMLDDMAGGSPTPSYGAPPSGSGSGAGGIVGQIGSLIGAAGQAAGQIMGAVNQYPGNQMNPGGYPPGGFGPYVQGINQWMQPGMPQPGMPQPGMPYPPAMPQPGMPQPGMIPGQTGVNAYGQPINAAGQVLSTTGLPVSALPATASSTLSSQMPLLLGLGVAGLAAFLLLK